MQTAQCCYQEAEQDMHIYTYMHAGYNVTMWLQGSGLQRSDRKHQLRLLKVLVTLTYFANLISAKLWCVIHDALQSDLISLLVETGENASHLQCCVKMSTRHRLGLHQWCLRCVDSDDKLLMQLGLTSLSPCLHGRFELLGGLCKFVAVSPAKLARLQPEHSDRCWSELEEDLL